MKYCKSLVLQCSDVFLNIESLMTPSGKTDITSMMLDAGAETSLVNSVGRTAAQMAAFVGGTDKDCKCWLTCGCEVSYNLTCTFSLQANMTVWQWSTTSSHEQGLSTTPDHRGWRENPSYPRCWQDPCTGSSWPPTSTQWKWGLLTSWNILTYWHRISEVHCHSHLSFAPYCGKKCIDIVTIICFGWCLIKHFIWTKCPSVSCAGK